MPHARSTGSDTLRDTLALLEDALDRVNTTENLTEFLEGAKVFWRYSAGNVLLLSSQAKQRGFRPSMVAGYREWEREGRHPLKRTRSLRILAPAMSRGYSITTPGSSEPTVVYRKVDIPAGSTVLGETTGRPRFTTAHVFDVSQTEGTPLPDRSHIALTPNEAAAALQTGLTRELVTAGFTVIVSDSQRGRTGGHTNHEAREVVIPGWMPSTDRAAILAHEYAHAMLHGPDDPLGRQYSLDTGARGMAEVEAEATAFLILAAHGIDSTERSSQYLAGWSDAVLEATTQRIPDDTAPGVEARPTRRSEVVRGALSRISSTAKTALMAIEPRTSGGKPGPAYAGINSEIAATAIATGPVVGIPDQSRTLGWG